MAKRKNKKITEINKDEAEDQIIEERTPIAYDTREYTVQAIVDMYENKEWIVPRYQRDFDYSKLSDVEFLEKLSKLKGKPDELLEDKEFLNIYLSILHNLYILV